MIHILLFINMILIYQVIITSLKLKDYKKSYNKIKKQLTKHLKSGGDSLEKELLKYGLSSDRIQKLKDENRISIKGL